MSAGFTPGPWQTAPNFPHGMTKIVDSDGATKPYTLVATAENTADARLIAAAPTLLSTLRRAYDHVLKDASGWFEDGSFEQRAMQAEAEQVLAVLISLDGEKA